MTVDLSPSSSLMLAILAMDAYNEGYNAGVDLPSGFGPGANDMLGVMTIGIDSSALIGAASAGFYAISYSSPTTEIIAYRGTDNQTLFSSTLGGGSDILNGWLIGAGWSAASQARYAQEFYNLEPIP